MQKKLYKTSYNKMISGVCNGLAEYFNIDVTIVRAVFVILSMTGIAPGLLLYIVLAIMLPVKNE